MAQFIEGYQELSWLGSKVLVYKQTKDELIGLMSAVQTGKEEWQARQTIDKIDNDFFHFAKMNCNFFDMGNGQHYGVEQGFTANLAPKQSGWYVVHIDENNIPHYNLSNDYWLDKSDVTLAFSPCAILRHENQDLELRSTSANQSLATKTNNSMLLYMGDGKYAFMVTGANLTSLQCRDFAKAYGAVGIYECDGGGSSQLIVCGAKKQYTGRAIANVLTFYKKSLTATVEEPKKEELTEDKINKLIELNQKYNEDFNKIIKGE
jgi:hypothetical protein